MSERRIALTDEQFDRLWDAHQSAKCAPEMLASMFTKAVEDSVKTERKFWESVARLAGVDYPGKGRFLVDWVNRCIVVKAESEPGGKD